MSRSRLVRWWQRSLGSKARRLVRSCRLRVEPLEQRELLDGAAVINYSDLGPSGRLVTGFYYDLLGRQPEVAEVTSWTNAIGSNLDNVGIAKAFIGSDEYHAKLLRNDYRALLNRDADPAGLAAWLQKMRTGVPEQQILT